MSDQIYDIVICGAGPIGAAAAYYLAKAGQTNVLLLTQEETDQAKQADHSDTYNWAGGSIRWYWPDPAKAEMPKFTAGVINELLEQGVDLSSVAGDHYLFVHRGLQTPALNIASAKLVNYFISQAVEAGVTYQLDTKVTAVTAADGVVTVSTSKGNVRAKKVLMALGVSNAKVIPDLKLETEKRQLYVLDLPVDDDRVNFPHTVVPVGDGMAYAFLKHRPDGLKVVVGQEEVVDEGDEPGANDNFKNLLDAGLGDIMPFLKDANVTEVLWGFDIEGKFNVAEPMPGVYAANSGSAVRSCAWIGRTLAEKLAA